MTRRGYLTCVGVFAALGFWIGLTAGSPLRLAEGMLLGMAVVALVVLGAPR
jgi:hypothetical protein